MTGRDTAVPSVRSRSDFRALSVVRRAFRYTVDGRGQRCLFPGTGGTHDREARSISSRKCISVAL